MGLDTTHNCWHGSYSGFSSFRAAVAEAAKEQYGYEPDYHLDAHPGRAYQGWWDNDHPYGDALDVLFIHSDCDGYIFPDHGRELALRLEPLVPLVGEWGERLQEFITGLIDAAEEWEVVGFH